MQKQKLIDFIIQFMEASLSRNLIFLFYDLGCSH